MRINYSKNFLLLVIFLLFLWLGGFVYFIKYVNHLKSDYSTKTDAIIVLTGDKGRIREAYNILNLGLADKLFITGAGKTTNIDSIIGISQEIPRDLIPEVRNKIFLERKALNTTQNASESKLWLQEHNIASIRLVTSNYHMPRSLAEFKMIMPEVEIIPHPSKCHSKKYKERLKLLWIEYNKTLYSFIKERD